MILVNAVIIAAIPWIFDHTEFPETSKFYQVVVLTKNEV